MLPIVSIIPVNISKVRIGISWVSDGGALLMLRSGRVIPLAHMSAMDAYTSIRKLMPGSFAVRRKEEKPLLQFFSLLTRLFPILTILCTC